MSTLTKSKTTELEKELTFLREVIPATLEAYQEETEDWRRKLLAQSLSALSQNLGQRILVRDKKGQMVPLTKKNPDTPPSAYRKELERLAQPWMAAHHLAANEVMFATSAPVRRSKHTWEA